MNREFEVTNQLHLKALSHPLRLGILHCLKNGDMTNEQLAVALGVESGKLYFHTKKLLDADMIEVAEMRPKGPITEKYYRAVSDRFTANAAIATGDDAPAAEILSAAQDLYREAYRDFGDGSLEPQIAFHLVLPQSVQRRYELIERLRELAAEFQETEAGTEDTTLVSFSVLLHTIPSGAGLGVTTSGTPQADRPVENDQGEIFS